MSDIAEIYAALRSDLITTGILNRRAATDDYDACHRRCVVAGLVLTRHSPAHYSISPLGGETIEGRQPWRLNVYPGNRRVYMDRNRAAAPFLGLPGDWTLEDVVTAVVEASKENY